MASVRNLGVAFMSCVALMALGGCGGDSGGSVSPAPTPSPTPTPAPTPTPTPTPTPITAAQFAAVTSVNGISISAETQLNGVNASSNNSVNGTKAALNGLYPLSTTSLTPFTFTSPIDAFFTNNHYVGALEGPADTTFQGWTCNSTSAQFAPSGMACTSVPAVGPGAATAACPKGTIDDGVVSSGFRACRLPSRIQTSLNLPKISGVFYRIRGQTEISYDHGSGRDSTTVTLNISPGVVLAADSSESGTDMLIVNRGSAINAVGTALEPIIFTSEQNLIANGVAETTQGQWGGIVLLGSAATSSCDGGLPNTAAGLSTCNHSLTGVTGRIGYGGNRPSDGSGYLQYVQIRYGGVKASDGTELPGLMLAGVGRAAGDNNISIGAIDHIQVHNSGLDGVAIFGGNPRIRYLAITGASDDSLAIDDGYRGFIQFLITAQRQSSGNAESFSLEADSDFTEEALPRTYGRIANFTFIQRAPALAGIRIRGGADMTLDDGVVVTPASVACINIMSGAQSLTGPITIRPTDPKLQEAGPPAFRSVYFACQGR